MATTPDDHSAAARNAQSTIASAFVPSGYSNFAPSTSSAATSSPQVWANYDSRYMNHMQTPQQHSQAQHYMPAAPPQNLYQNHPNGSISQHASNNPNMYSPHQNSSRIPPGHHTQPQQVQYSHFQPQHSQHSQHHPSTSQLSEVPGMSGISDLPQGSESMVYNGGFPAYSAPLQHQSYLTSDDPRNSIQTMYTSSWNQTPMDMSNNRGVVRVPMGSYGSPSSPVSAATPAVGRQGTRGPLPVQGNSGPLDDDEIEPKQNAEGKWVCPSCPSTFSFPKHVKRHYMRHTGERPYECLCCHTTFARSDVLKRHYEKCSERTPGWRELPPEARADHLQGRRGRPKRATRKKPVRKNRTTSTDGSSNGRSLSPTQNGIP